MAVSLPQTISSFDFLVKDYVTLIYRQMTLENQIKGPLIHNNLNKINLQFMVDDKERGSATRLFIARTSYL